MFRDINTRITTLYNIIDRHAKTVVDALAGFVEGLMDTEKETVPPNEYQFTTHLDRLLENLRLYYISPDEQEA